MFDAERLRWGRLVVPDDGKTWISDLSLPSVTRELSESSPLADENPTILPSVNGKAVFFLHNGLPV